MRLSITRKVALGFGLFLVLLAVASVLAVLNGFALVRNSAAMFHSHTVLSRLATVSIMTRDVQTGYRGFVITGRDEFLEHYTSAAQGVLPELDQLHANLAGDPGQAGRVEALRGLIQEQLQHGTDLIEIRRMEGVEAATARISSGRGKAIMDEIRLLTGHAIAAEQDSLTRCRADAEAILRRTIATTIFGGVFGLLAIGAAIFVLNVDIHERERLEEALLEAGDREQRRMGQDLHDGLCQQLAGIAYLAQTLRENLDAKSMPEADAARRISELVGGSVSDARRLSHGLHPVELVEDGLMLALADLAVTTEKTFGIRCSFECPDPVLVSENEVALHLYRIAQEAVHNAARHARPSTIRIGLLACGDTPSLEIRDDGAGMPPTANDTRGIGLHTMRFRADHIGGVLEVSSQPGAGTSVICRFPAGTTTGEDPPDEGGTGVPELDA